MRKRPYTKRGIGRVPCFRCGSPSRYQWMICADGNQYRGMCASCDVGLNEMTLRYVRDPNRRTKMRAYRARVTDAS